VFNADAVNGINLKRLGSDVPKSGVDMRRGAERDVGCGLAATPAECRRPRFPVAYDGVADVVCPGVGGGEVAAAVGLAVFVAELLQNMTSSARRTRVLSNLAHGVRAATISRVFYELEVQGVGLTAVVPQNPHCEQQTFRGHVFPPACRPHSSSAA
jgi:hypothetical protein